MLDIEQDICSLTDFTSNANALIDQMRTHGHPLVVTIDDHTEFVVQDAASYQVLLERLDELEALEGIRRGLADVQAGRVTPLRQFEKEFREMRGLPGRSH